MHVQQWHMGQPQGDMGAEPLQRHRRPAAPSRHCASANDLEAAFPTATMHAFKTAASATCPRPTRRWPTRC